ALPEPAGAGRFDRPGRRVAADEVEVRRRLDVPARSAGTAVRAERACRAAAALADVPAELAEDDALHLVQLRSGRGEVLRRARLREQQALEVLILGISGRAAGVGVWCVAPDAGEV